MKVLVVGGTSFIGRYLVGELLKAGHDVTVLHRQPKHLLGRRVGNLVGDRNDAGAVRAALAEATKWDPRSAEIIVGTSAGSRVGAMLRAGVSAGDLAAFAAGDPPSEDGARFLARLGPPANLPPFTLAGLFAALCTISMCMTNGTIALSRQPGINLGMLLGGLSEVFAAAAISFAFLTIGWVCVAIGLRRQGPM
jgi:hypothetical protein